MDVHDPKLEYHFHIIAGLIQFKHLEAMLPEQMPQPVRRIAGKIVRRLVFANGERTGDQYLTTRFQHPMQFPEHFIQVKDMLEYLAAENGVESPGFEWDMLAVIEDVDLFIKVRMTGILEIDAGIFRNMEQ